MLVRDLMTPSPHTLHPGASLGDALAVMGKRGIRHLPIVEKGKIVGMISERDVKMALGPDAINMDIDQIDPRQADGQVDWFMVENVRTIDADANLAEACRLFAASKIGALPVVHGGKLVGILSVIDLLEAAVPLFETKG